MASKIFISYRRDDSAGTAGRLHDRLAERFGQENLFIDVDNMPAGADFVEHLGKQVANCDIFLCTVGPNWLNAKDDDGRRRLDQPDDYVRVEIAEALKRTIPVIPVLIDGARVPKRGELPDDIAPLTRRQAVEVRNSNFRRDADDLTQKISGILREKRSPPRRVVLAAIVGTVALLAFGSIGIYQAGTISLPWRKEASTKETSKDPLHRDLVTDCDWLAAGPTDSQRPKSVPGVDFKQINIGSAVVACREAVNKYPDVARFSFQLGRVLDVSKDYLEARKQYEIAAKLGNATALNNIGLLYENGKGVPQDYAEAKRWYEKAAAAGEPNAMNNIGTFYEGGKGVQQDYAEAKRWYEKAAAAGLPNARFNIGILYENGKGVPRDYAEAKRWYEKAADAGTIEAMGAIGLLYENGKGVPQDYAEAKRWYEKAADAGLSNAMFNIGTLYDNGKGVQQDYAEAKRWYEKAAAAGLSNAMFMIGFLYDTGKGVRQDYSEAKRWYEKAATAGMIEATFAIGALYEMGHGVPQDYAEARRWYEKGAAGGSALAMRELGDLYRDGHGGPKSVADARTWYQKAVAAGDATAKDSLARLPAK